MYESRQAEYTRQLSTPSHSEGHPFYKTSWGSAGDAARLAQLFPGHHSALLTLFFSWKIIGPSKPAFRGSPAKRPGRYPRLRGVNGAPAMVAAARWVGDQPFLRLPPPSVRRLPSDRGETMGALTLEQHRPAKEKKRPVRYSDRPGFNGCLNSASKAWPTGESCWRH